MEKRFNRIDFLGLVRTLGRDSLVVGSPLYRVAQHIVSNIDPSYPADQLWVGLLFRWKRIRMVFPHQAPVSRLNDFRLCAGMHLKNGIEIVKVPDRTRRSP